MTQVRRRLNSGTWKQQKESTPTPPLSPIILTEELSSDEETVDSKQPRDNNCNSTIMPDITSPPSFNSSYTHHHTTLPRHHSNHNSNSFRKPPPSTTNSNFKAFTQFRKRSLLSPLLIFLFCFYQSITIDVLFQSYGLTFKDLTNGTTRILSPKEIKKTFSSRSELKHTIPVSVSEAKEFSVVINTYKRPDMLALAVDHYARTCGRESGVGQVFVVWAELDVEPPKNIEEVFLRSPQYAAKSNEGFLRRDGDANTSSSSSGSSNENDAPLKFIRVPKDSLNSRFLPIQGLENDALFMVDDDVQVSCPTLKTGFEAWTYNSNTLVGYYPRLASPPLSPSDDEESRSLVYHTWPVVYARDKFNFILTKACFLHRKYTDMYFNPKHQPKEVLEYVDKDMNCEDIAMAFLVAKETYDPKDDRSNSEVCKNCPVYVEGSITDLGLTNGISTSGGSMAIAGHMTKRSECLTVIKEIYERHGWDFPLFEVGLREQGWLHHFPGSWWQNRPSNFFEWFSFGNTLS